MYKECSYYEYLTDKQSEFNLLLDKYNNILEQDERDEI